MKIAFASFLLWVGAVALLGFVALLSAIAEDVLFVRPSAVVTPAARMWTDTGSPAPQFCPAPMPICTGDGCKRRSKA